MTDFENMRVRLDLAIEICTSFTHPDIDTGIEEAIDILNSIKRQWDEESKKVCGK